MFRINLFLKFSQFIKAIFLSYDKKICEETISNEIKNQTKKKKILITSQCRVGFLYLLKYLRINLKNKNEIIFVSYNLAEMINVAKNLKYRIKFIDLQYKNGAIDLKELIKITSKKTCAIVLTNMFNNYSDSLKIKKFCNIKEIKLIEDNAIFFDNFTKRNKDKIYSGSLGDYTLYSFNIMKHISAFFGGAIATNDKNFYKYFMNEREKMKTFHKIKLLKQITIFLILKLMSIKILYKVFFFYVIKYAHIKKRKFLLELFYPSLKFKKYHFNKSYFTSVSNLTLKSTYLQILDRKYRADCFKQRKMKNIYYQKKLIKLGEKNINLIKIKDFNYQNYIDYPILVKDKKKLNSYLLKRGFEIRYLYYKNCEPIFSKVKNHCNNSKKYEKELICLPNHKKITFKYIDKLLINIGNFYNLDKSNH